MRNGTGERVRARAVLKKEMGCVGGRRGQESRRACARAGPRRAREGRADRGSHGAARGNRRTGGNGSAH
jgi:hypothetical protein